MPHRDMIVSHTHSQKSATGIEQLLKANDGIAITNLQLAEPNVPSTSQYNVTETSNANIPAASTSGTFENVQVQVDTADNNTENFVFSLGNNQFTTVNMDKEIVTFLEDQFEGDAEKNNFPVTVDGHDIMTPVSQQPILPARSEMSQIQQSHCLPSSGFVLNQTKTMVFTGDPPKKKQKWHQGRGPGTGPVPKHLQQKGRFYCDVCPRNYSTPYDLKVHQRDACGKDPVRIDCPYKQQCGKDFIHEKNLNQHIATHHTGNHLFTCLNCGKGISYSHIINIHKRKCKPNRTSMMRNNLDE